MPKSTSMEAPLVRCEPVASSELYGLRGNVRKFVDIRTRETVCYVGDQNGTPVVVMNKPAALDAMQDVMRYLAKETRRKAC